MGFPHFVADFFMHILSIIQMMPSRTIDCPGRCALLAARVNNVLESFGQVVGVPVVFTLSIDAFSRPCLLCVWFVATLNIYVTWYTKSDLLDSLFSTLVCHLITVDATVTADFL